MTPQNPIPLTFSEQVNQGLWLLLTIALAAPIIFTIADWWAL